ncbi:MAG: permease [Nanoarchaeota archaeon]|nr:permease [Nanoarchaeota archaeon]
MEKVENFLKKNWILFVLFFSYLIIFLWQNPISTFLSGFAVKSMIGESIYQGWLGLVDYLSAHVLMCLIPAFFIAGAINTLIGTGSIVKYLSGKTKKWLAYIIAAVGGFFIEVCSCTILPLFAGIWKKGAGLGIATTFLYAGPAINIITFILTGQRLGWTLATVRLVLSIVFAISVGLIMEFAFKNEKHEKKEMNINETEHSLKGVKSKIFWAGLFAILIVGTAPIPNTIKTPIILVLAIIQAIIAMKWLTYHERKDWWEETLKFTTDIIPLLLIGVFLAAAFTNVIPQEKFQQFAGKNTILTNLAAVGFGAIAYFPALVEVPIAEGFMRLGMNKGPLLAYLLSDPVLSLQGLLIISKLIGWKKTGVYAGSIVVLTTLAGLVYGLI